jgi:signal transduction histidine kinase
MELDLAGVATEDDARRTHLQRARDGLGRMERLVAQLLTLARVESLDRLADQGRLDVAVLAQQVVAEAGERAAPRGVALSLQADDPVRVRASAGLLEIALRNLIDNAIAHGRPRGNVYVIVGPQPDGVEIAVEDDGPGFPENQVGRAGERFARGEQSRGSGLGLSIVRAIAALHGGSVTVSRSAAGGARVALHLPSASVVDNAK